MKRSIQIALGLLLFTTVFTACKKESAKEPELVICYFEPYVPIRVISAQGEDLLDPAKLSGGTIEMKWETPGTNMPVTRMNPNYYNKSGQPDQYYISAPLTNAAKGLSVYFSLKAGDIDTLFIRTAADTTNPNGVTEVSFNGVKVAPKMLFGTTQYGIEVVK